MKIIFICGSLEPGADGVGDYCRRLAGELIRLGNSAGIIAMNDRYIGDKNEVYQEDEKNEQIPVLRLSNKLTWKNREALAKNWIDNFNPEWISLQYIAFSFQKKGLPLGFDNILKRIGVNRKWHILLPELWVGMEKDAPIKIVLWGKVQEYIIIKMIRKLKPLIINTHARLYEAQLQNKNIAASYFPLFSNIPLSQTVIKEINSTKVVNFIIFGTIFPEAPVEPFAQKMAYIQNKYNYQFVMNFIGRNGNELKKWMNTFKVNGIEVNNYGELESSRVSFLLSQADFGISTYPTALIEKSGTFAAMTEHGLKVICVSIKWESGIKFEKLPVPENVHDFNKNSIDVSFFEKINRKEYREDRLKQVTRDFLENLSGKM